jgi:hypothetical protein
MEKRVGICPQPVMSSTSLNLYFFLFKRHHSDVFRLNPFSVTCLLKRRKEKKKAKNVHTVEWTVPVNRLPTLFDILTCLPSPIFIVFHRVNYGTRKKTVTFGEWKTVKAISFGAYLAKIECDTASVRKCFWSIPSTLPPSSYAAPQQTLRMKVFLPIPFLKLYPLLLNPLKDFARIDETTVKRR